MEYCIVSYSDIFIFFRLYHKNDMYIILFLNILLRGKKPL